MALGSDKIQRVANGSLHLKITPAARRRSGPFTVPSVAFAIYVCMTLSVLFNHEPWRDEAQAWLIARDIDLWTLISAQAGYEGSPVLWHLLNMPLAKLDQPYLSQRLLNWTFAAITAAMVLWKSPFPLWLRIGFCFSNWLVFEYAIIARSYALGVALGFSIAMIFSHRNQRPIACGSLIALLANTNIYGLLMAFGFGVSWLLSLTSAPRRRVLIGLGVAVVGGVCAAAQMIPPDDSWRHAANASSLPGLRFELPRSVVPFVLALAPMPIAWLPESMLGRLTLALLAAVVWALLFIRVTRPLWAAMPFLCLSVGIFAITLLERDVYLRGAGHLMIGYLLSRWIVLNSANASVPVAGGLLRSFERLKLRLSRASDVALAASLAVSIALGARLSALDFTQPFSGSADMAAFLLANELDQRPIVGHQAPIASAVLPFLPRRTFVYPGLDDHGSFVVWNTAQSDAHRIEPEELELARFESDVLFLFSKPVESDGLTLIHFTPPDITGERMYLYERSRSAAGD